MFRGFSGYIQADAHAIYDALFRGEAVDDESVPPTEVGCWSHARRRFWEAAVSGIRILPYWPRERVLELAPAYWASTRARLDPTELDAELGEITVPPFATDTPEQAAAS